RTPIAAHLGVGAWDGTTPLECPINGQIEVNNITTTLEGTAIHAGVNCRLRIIGSHITADTVVELGPNVELVVEGSTLTGRDRGIQAGPNARLFLRRAQVSGGHVAIEGGSNMHVHLDGSRVTGGPVQPDADAGLAKGAVGTAIDGGPNLNVRAVDST